MPVLVIDKNKKPLDPCRPARARILLKEGRAAVFRRYPFTIIIKDRTAEESVVHDHRLKLDPGSETTGIGIVQKNTDKVVFAAELEHRGKAIASRMYSRKILRRTRRGRKTRY